MIQQAEQQDFPDSSIGVPVTALWKWIPNQNRPLSILIEALKNHPIHSDWDVVAVHLSKRALVNRTSQPPDAFIPCPGTNQTDHAKMLANSLGRIWRKPVLSVLSKSTPRRSQKRLDREGRREISFLTNENFSIGSLAKHRVVFVDDIVTTGATARAAKRSLGPIRSFEVWCVAQRHLATEWRL